ncbi:ROK family transcriptional regulator [Catenulispora sp. NF23]|uniref:ROK family transcriptional regulator n=1 Tax=Catenulispora pinistramenti TaxID=2705254 RepID=UPI001BA5F83C|nr:ROK family transcriptional regulator [Catenulispora pinistramenti]MBS2536349.1 ROK family transcriptional regulator [Catenulispora pinistramenti]
MRRTSGDGSFLRSLNEVAVLRALRETGTPTLAEVARTAQLSRATTEVIMDSLLRHGWVVEAEAVADGQRGRPARRYTFRAAAAHVAGVAIGGSGVTAMVADLDGDVVGRAVEHLSPELPAGQRLTAVQRVLERAAGAADVPLSRLATVGVGTTGVIDNEGRVLKSVALTDWSGVELQHELAARLPVPVVVENDMRLAVLAEHWRGAASGHDNVLYLHTGRRIGLGLLLNGVPYRGSHAAAGELGGHPNGRWAAFGYVMDYAMAVDPSELRAPLQAALFAMERADAGDHKATLAFDAFARALAEGLISLVTPLDPDLVVIGGSLAQTGERLTEPIRALLGEVCLYPPDVRVSELGGDAVGMGAVRFALDHAEPVLFASLSSGTSAA